MNLIFVVALIAACGAAKLDRRYLPPSSSQYAGGPPGSLQAPFFTTRINGINQGSLQTPFGRTSDNNPSQGSQFPPGSYENEHQGVVVEAAAPGTRASNQLSGLGGPRENYGSTDSKVGEAAFRGTKNQAIPNNGGFQSQSQFGSFNPQGSVGVNNQDYPDLSAFHQPIGQVNTGYRPENQLFTDRVSNIVKYHMNIGLNKFNYGYETENGIKMEENGVSNDGVNTQGGYSYTGSDGKVYSVVYTAGKDGYRPMGSHLPTPPPIPAEILESLQQNARDEANGIKDDGSYDAQKYNAEDDYTQSDTNSNNDRQSNKFGKRPGFDAGAGAVINQNQQGFESPNVQGHFNSYEISKNSSSIQPDTSKFGTVVSDYNKGQSNEVGRPGSNVGANTLFNQYQQDYANVQNQFTSNDFTKDPSSRQPDTSKFGTGVSGGDYTSNKGNILAQTGQITQFDNRFGAQFQYLPPRPPGNFLDTNSFLQIDSSKVGFNNNFNNAQPHLEQNFQDQGSNGKPILTITKPNAYGTSNGQGSSNDNSPPSIQGSSSFGINSNNNRPQNDGTFFQSGIQSSFIGSNLGLEFGGNAQNSPIMYGNGSLPISGSSQENFNNKPQTQGFLSTPIFNAGITSQNNFNNSPQNQGSFSQIGDGQKENINLDLSNRFSPTLSSQTLPTKQPDLILTTPLQEQQTDSGSSVPTTSSIDSQPQKPYSINFGNFQSILSSNEKPSEGQFNSNLPGQLQGPDNSYIYNKPSKPFNTPYQDTTGSSKYPQLPTLAPIAPTLPTLQDETEKNKFQSNGITQASISSFPSITPTFSSQTNSGELYEYTKPAQGLPSSFQEENAGEMNQQSLIPSSQNEGTIKPQVTSESNTQFGQRFPTPSTSAFGIQTTPSRLGVQTTFGQKPSQSQFSEQGTYSFGQIPTLSPFGAQTSSLFGQKPTQQQFGSQTSFAFGQQTIPPRFSAQTSTPLGQKQTVSPFDGQTSTTLNQQTTPMRFGAQTSSSFGQIPTQPQTSFSFGQQTTPSRFGGQTSSSFGQQPILSSIGAQTTSSFGQTQTPNGQTSFSFGQQTTPSRFGTQTSSTFGQNPSQSQTSTQTSISFGTQTTPSRFVVQTGSSIGQKAALSSFSTSLNKQTTPSCCSQTSSSFGQQTIPSRFGTETSSTFGQTLTQSQLGVPTSFSTGAQTTPPRFETQTSSFSGQQTTPTPFGEQTSTLFEQKTTPSQISVQTGSSFGQQTTPSRFSIQSSSITGQQTTPTPFVEQTSSTFGQKITTAQLFDSSSEQLLSTTQIGGDFNKQHQSQSQESNEQSEDQSSKQSTLQPTTFNSQNSQESVENTNSDEIYQYNKPTTSFTFNQQSQGSTQFSQQSTTQSDEQSFSPNSQNKEASIANQQSEVTLFPRFPEQSKVTNSPFESGPSTNQFVLPTTSEQSFDSKESTNSDFSSTDVANAQYQPSTLFPSLSNSFNSQKQEQSQNSQSGEVYQYNKPAQSLPDSSQNKLDTTKPISSQSSQSNEKLDNVQLPTQSDENVSQTQTDSEPQIPSSSTLGTLPSSHPFPHLSFYSACCRGPKPQNGQTSQSFSSKVPSSPQTGNLGGNSFGSNKNDNQDTNGSGLKENKFGNQEIGIQKDTPSFVGKGEEFGGPREPPKFDETGYHY